MSTEHFVVATHSGTGDQKNLVVVGTYRSLNEAKGAVESMAAMLLSGAHDALTIYKLTEESNKVHSFRKHDLKHVFQKMASNLNTQADDLRKQAQAAASALEDEDDDGKEYVE